jgi:Na+-transporting methylmalonyl-CoA/oxaloacetate decarboxylase gamma subunit
MDLKISKNSNKKPFKEGKVYIIFYYPPEIRITEDSELLRLFRGAKDTWTVITKEGQEQTVEAILLFYGLPIRKKELEKLKELEDKDLDAYYQNSLVYLFSTLTNYKQGFVKRIAHKLAFKKVTGKPIKIKDINEDIEINQGDAIEKAFSYYLQVQNLGSIYTEITKSKSWIQGGKKIASFIAGADVKTIVNIGVVIMIIVILVLMYTFMSHAIATFSSSIRPPANLSNVTNISGHAYPLNNPIGP